MTVPLWLEELKKAKPTMKERIRAAEEADWRRMYESPESKAQQEQMAQVYRPKSDFFQGDK